MKRLLGLLVAMMLAVCPLAAAESWYVAEGEKLAERICALASDATYIQFYTGSGEITEQVERFAQSDFSRIAEARLLSLPDFETTARLMRMLGALSGEELPELSDVAMKELAQRFPSAIAAVINGQYSASWLATANILRTSETYVMPEDFQPGLLLLEYPGEYSVAVAFAQTGENTVTASADVIHSGFLKSLVEDMPLLARIAVEAMFGKVELE